MQPAGDRSTMYQSRTFVNPIQRTLGGHADSARPEGIALLVIPILKVIKFLDVVACRWVVSGDLRPNLWPASVLVRYECQRCLILSDRHSFSQCNSARVHRLMLLVCGVL